MCIRDSAEAGEELSFIAVLIQVEDAAGNLSMTNSVIEFDPVAPQMESATSESFYNAGQTVIFRIQLTEPVFDGGIPYDGPATLRATEITTGHAIELQKTSHHATNWVYERALSGGSVFEGNYHIDYANAYNSLPALLDACLLYTSPSPRDS